MKIRNLDYSDPLDEQTSLLRTKGLKQHAADFRTAVMALRTIHTWASFDAGSTLVPLDVARLVEKTLKPWEPTKQ